MSLAVKTWRLRPSRCWMDTSSRIMSRQNRSFSKLLDSTLLVGKATPEGTAAFVEAAKLPLHHCFQRNQLYVNPLICGPSLSPEENSPDSIRDAVAHALTDKSMNAVYVYRHMDSINNNTETCTLEDMEAEGKSRMQNGGFGKRGMTLEEKRDRLRSIGWSLGGSGQVKKSTTESNSKDTSLTAETTEIRRALANFKYTPKPNEDKPYTVMLMSNILEEMNIPRESVVTIASLGAPAPPAELLRRLHEARHLSGLETIDCLILEVDEQTAYSRHFADSIDLLEAVAHIGLTQFIGLRMDLLPYSFHNPRPKGSVNQRSSVLPVCMEVENIQSSQAKKEDSSKFDTHMDLFLYPISPSIALPTSLPMMDPEDNSRRDPSRSIEQNRLFSRAAMEPFILRPGLGQFPDTELFNTTAELSTADQQTMYAAMRNIAQQYDLAMLRHNLPSALEESLCDALDDLVPELRTSPRLEEKVLRVVFSTGMDLAVVDLEFTGLLPRLRLRAEHMLSYNQTQSIFGQIATPPISLDDDDYEEIAYNLEHCDPDNEGDAPH